MQQASRKADGGLRHDRANKMYVYFSLKDKRTVTLAPETVTSEPETVTSEPETNPIHVVITL